MGQLIFWFAMLTGVAGMICCWAHGAGRARVAQAALAVALMCFGAALTAALVQCTGTTSASRGDGRDHRNDFR